MKRWFTGQQIFKKYDVQAFELLKYMRNGLQAYTVDGRKVIDEDTLEHGRKETLKEIEYSFRAKVKAPFKSIGDVDNHYSSLTPEMDTLRLLYNTKPTLIGNPDFSLDDFIGKVAKAAYEQQPLDIILNAPEGSCPFSFKSGDLEKIKSFQFKRPDLLEYLGMEDVKDKPNIPTSTKQIDPEEFVRSLSIAKENDTEIKIKVGDKKTKTYSCKDIGFKEDSKTWRTFIQILQSQDHIFHVGAARGANKVRNKIYDANRGIKREIGKKFVIFLNKTYKQQLLDNFEIFELIKNGPSGEYKLKFTIANFNIDNAHYEDYLKDDLITEIEKLSSNMADLKTKGDEYSEDRYMQATNNLEAAVMIATKKGWLDRNRAKSYLNPDPYGIKNVFSDFEDVYEEGKPVQEDY